MAAADLVQRDFTARGPDQLWVAVDRVTVAQARVDRAEHDATHGGRGTSRALPA